MGGERTLIEILGIRAGDPERRLDAAIKRLRSSIDAKLGPRTGVVSLTVKAPRPVLAQQVTDKLLEELNRFNLQTRQSQAAAERRFTEQRLQEVQADLRQAEDGLQAFLQRNRDFVNSPVLQFQHDRLEREVLMRQQVYTTLVQAHEQAKIEEVRDTPVLTIIEPASLPLEADRRGLLVSALVALVLGFVLSSLWAVGAAFLRATQAPYQDEIERFARLKTEALEDLRHPWRTIRGGLRTHSSDPSRR